MREKRKKKRKMFEVFVLFEILFFLFFVTLFPNLTTAIVGQNNVTVTTNLTVGNAQPIIVNVTIVGGSDSVGLTPNSTTTTEFVVILRDYNGEDDLFNLTMRFFDTVASGYSSSPDNNNHYRNDTCTIDTSFGDALEANASCILNLEYYANNATWNITLEARDQSNLAGYESDLFTVDALLALGLPDNIDYGEVNTTEVSLERTATVINYGNVVFNLSLSGYGAFPGDGNAMNCSLGNNISAEYEKYNVTLSNSSVLNLSQFESLYVNLTNVSQINEFNINYRQNDTDSLTDHNLSTYWRIYVPQGSGGTCSGNLVFGAVQAPAS